MRWWLTAALAVGLCGPAQAASLTHDVNGDGIQDFAYPDHKDQAPGANVIFGNRDRTAPPSASQLGDGGFRIKGGGGGGIVNSADVIGDVNGDELADVMVTTESGATYVVYGKRDTEPVTLSDGDEPLKPFRSGTAGFIRYLSDAYTLSAGDVNGDGLADAVYDTGGGRTFARVLFGARRNPWKRGFYIKGAGRVKSGPNTPFAPAGDTNGDGRDDLLVSVPTPGGYAPGFDFETTVFVVWGRRGTQQVDLVEPHGPLSFGVRVGKRPAGRALLWNRRRCTCQISDTNSLAPVGDLNGDGMGEVGLLLEDIRRTGAHTDPLEIFYGSRSSKPGKAGATVRDIDIYDSLGAAGNLIGDRHPDVFVPVGAYKPALLDGRRAHGVLDANSLPAITTHREVSVIVPAGDVDADGLPDLLISYGGLGHEKWALIYGVRPFAPVDFSDPSTAPNVTLLPK